MENYFQRSKENPYHVSVGAVLINDRSEVCTHYFKDFFHPAVGRIADFYTLMRETLERDETLEAALHRGLMEEFGAKGEVLSFLGSLVATTPQEDYFFQKNTLYFLVNLLDMEPSRRSSADKEIGADIRWVTTRELIPIMKEQGKRLQREDLDESIVLERALEAIS